MRRSRAIKLWMSMRTCGAGRFREAVDREIGLAEFAEAEVRRHPDKWEIATPAQIGVVCFALSNWKPGEHAARAKDVSDSGFA